MLLSFRLEGSGFSSGTRMRFWSWDPLFHAGADPIGRMELMGDNEPSLWGGIVLGAQGPF
jgi:hypothetical protein